MKIPFKKNIIASLLVPVLAMGCKDSNTPSADTKKKGKPEVETPVNTSDANANQENHQKFLPALRILDPKYAKDAKIESFDTVLEAVKKTTSLSLEQVCGLNQNLVFIENEMSQDAQKSFDALKDLGTAQLDKLAQEKSKKAQEAFRALYKTAQIELAEKDALDTGAAFKKLIKTLKESQPTEKLYPELQRKLSDLCAHADALDSLAKRCKDNEFIQLSSEKTAHIKALKTAKDTLNKHAFETIDGPKEIEKVNKILTEVKAKIKTLAQKENALPKGDPWLKDIIANMVGIFKEACPENKQRVQTELEKISTLLASAHMPFELAQRGFNTGQFKDEATFTSAQQAMKDCKKHLAEIEKANAKKIGELDAQEQLTQLKEWQKLQSQHLEHLYALRDACACATHTLFNDPAQKHDFEQAKKQLETFVQKKIPKVLGQVAGKVAAHAALQGNAATSDALFAFLQQVNDHKDAFAAPTVEGLDTLDKLLWKQEESSSDDTYRAARTKTLDALDQEIHRYARQLGQFEQALITAVEKHKAAQLESIDASQELRKKHVFRQTPATLTPWVTLWDEVNTAQKASVDLLANQLVAARLLSIGLSGDLAKAKKIAELTIDSTLFNDKHIWRMMTASGGPVGSTVTVTDASASAAAANAGNVPTLDDIANANIVNAFGAVVGTVKDAGPAIIAAWYNRSRTGAGNIRAAQTNAAGIRVELAADLDTPTYPTNADVNNNPDTAAAAAVKHVAFQRLAQDARKQAEKNMADIRTSLKGLNDASQLHAVTYKRLKPILDNVKQQVLNSSALQKPVYTLQTLKEPGNTAAKPILNTLITWRAGKNIQDPTKDILDNKVAELSQNLREVHLLDQNVSTFTAQSPATENTIIDMYDRLVGPVALTANATENHSVNYFNLYHDVETKTDVKNQVKAKVTAGGMDNTMNNLEGELEKLKALYFDNIAQK